MMMQEAWSEHSNIPALFDAISDCVEVADKDLAGIAFELQRREWTMVSPLAIPLERSAPQSKGHSLVKGNVVISVSKFPEREEATFSRIIAFVGPDADRSELEARLQTDLGFVPLSRSSRFALAAPPMSDEVLAEFFQYEEHVVRIQFVEENGTIGVNITVASNG
ncbi:MAG: hypothetical protein AAF697_13915 [Pseudomonadota bacterium]